MSKVTRFEDLIAWQKGRSLVAAIYRTSSSSAFARDFTLKDQIRSAAISIPSNIAEGFERGRLGEFHQSLSIAKASCAEVRTQLYLAFDVQHIDEPTLSALLKQAEEVGRVIGGLRAAVAKERKHSELRTQHSGLKRPRIAND